MDTASTGLGSKGCSRDGHCPFPIKQKGNCCRTLAAAQRDGGVQGRAAGGPRCRRGTWGAASLLLTVGCSRGKGRQRGPVTLRDNSKFMEQEHISGLDGDGRIRTRLTSTSRDTLEQAKDTP